MINDQSIVSTIKFRKCFFFFFAQNINCGYTLEPPITCTESNINIMQET